MEILKYSKEHKQFRQRVRSFMEKEIIPFVDQWEKDRIMPRSAWKRMGEEGLLCVTIPSKYGGPGGDFLHSVIVSEELCRTNHNGAGPSLHSDLLMPYITSFGTEEIKKKYLPGCVSGDIITAFGLTEPGAGSDITSINTTAIESGDEIIINGSKIFTSNGINCDLLVLIARDQAVKKPYDAISLYIVEADTPGFEKGKKLDKMGWLSQDTAEIFFNDCRIPKANMLGQKGKGWQMLMKNLQPERLLIAIWGMVAAECILEWVMKYYKENSGSGKPVPKSQVNQFALVEMTTEVKLGRTFLDKLIADHVDGKNVITETSMAKFWITEMARRVADRALDLCGDFGTLETCPALRAWRDIRSMSIFGGTNEIMRKIIAGFMKL